MVDESRSHPKKVLVADDEPDILDVVHFRLVKKGYEVITAVDGKEALEKVAQHKPDLVILDNRMPFLKGLDVCRQMREDAALKHIPVILITASTDAIKQETLSSAGVNDYAFKPFEPEELFEKVKKLIG